MPNRVLLSSFTALAFALGAVPEGRASDVPLLRALGVPVEDTVRKAEDEKSSRRYAIVVGNDDYQAVPDLANAGSDAKAVAQLLRGFGFRVFESHNLDKRGFESLLSRVLVEVDRESEILFYYAGHGMQMGRRNYLVPTDAVLKSPYDAPFETVTLDSILAILSARSRLQLVILDSCRDNPFSNAKLMTEIDSELFEARDGFETVSTPFNSFLAYSTSPGEVALDGDGDNSVFTAAFVKAATDDPSLDVSRILSRVRRDVYRQTNGRQVPWDSSTLVEPFLLSEYAAALGAPTEPSLATGDSERTRSVYLVARSASDLTALPSTEAKAEGVQVAFVAPLDRNLTIGNSLSRSLKIDGRGIDVVSDAKSGRLVVDGPQPLDYNGETLSSGDLNRLYYEYRPAQRSAASEVESHIVRERFTVRAGGDDHTIEVALTPDACDFEAGDWLDPDGIGIARYPNELDPDAALAACAAAIERSPDNGRFHYQYGRALQALVRFDEAKAAYEKARDIGHVRAWYALGDLEAEAAAISGGRSDQPVSEEALRLYGHGVKYGDPYAYYALGKQLLRHSGNEVLEQEGFKLLNRALELGHTFAMNELGYYYLKEGSANFDAERGIRYLRESASRGDIYGYNNLGLVYENGAGNISADSKAAFEWYLKAAEGGHPYAPVSIGRLYFNGKVAGGVNAAKAIEWYDKGLERGVGWGGANASWIIANRKPQGYRPGDAAARAAKAATLRDPGASEQARSVLAGLPRRAKDEGAQILLNALGKTVAVDGVIGQQTLAAIESFATTEKQRASLSDPDERLLMLARAHWQRTKFRIDLY